MIFLQKLKTAAFRRLCVETQKYGRDESHNYQPPLGGCVLKLCRFDDFMGYLPAAFRRLCVETAYPNTIRRWHRQPPLGGCVLKQAARPYSPPSLLQPPLGGCVLKLDAQYFGVPQRRQPPLGGCVLKQNEIHIIS